MFFPIGAGYKLSYSISDPVTVFTVSCVRLLSDTAPNTQLDGYGILALVQVLTSISFLPTESISQCRVALL